VHCRFDLAARNADVPQGPVVELAKACNGGATDEIARDPLPTGVEKPGERVRVLRGRGPNPKRRLLVPDALPAGTPVQAHDPALSGVEHPVDKDRKRVAKRTARACRLIA
jgi:hypothetical protein